MCIVFLYYLATLIQAVSTTGLLLSPFQPTKWQHRSGLDLMYTQYMYTQYKVHQVHQLLALEDHRYRNRNRNALPII